MSFPAHPSIGVGAVVIHDDRVLLIQRGKEPLSGRWVVPGGTVELGESLLEAVVREVAEETGVTVRPAEVALVFDRIQRDMEGRVQYHFVIVDYLCDYVAGEPAAGSDAAAAAFVRREDLPAYDLPELAAELVEAAFKRVAQKNACGEGGEGLGSSSNALLLSGSFRSGGTS